MLVDSLLDRNERKARLTGFTALAGTVVALVWTFNLWDAPVVKTFNDMIVLNDFRLSFSVIFLIVTGLTILIAIHWTEAEDLPSGEFFTLIMFATTGMLLMAAANDLVMIFLGLETVSISTYVLAGYRRTDVRSNESSMKYFILGSFSTAFLLYGIALTYGATQSTNLVKIKEAVLAGNLTSEGLLFAGAAMMFIGFAFKTASAPFHVWAPDVYEGAPSPVTGFMASGPKAAAFVAFLAVFVLGYYNPADSGTTPEKFTLANQLTHHWTTVMTIVAVLTMTTGNVVAMVQTNIKRMLAYSSIAHAGYALVGFIAGDWKSVAFYMLAYSLLTVGSFAIITVIARKGDKLVNLDDYAGLGFKSLGLSLTLGLFLAALAGFPLTAGFMGKFLVFNAAWSKGLYALVVVSVLNSAASVYYYLRPIVKMFFTESDQTPESERLPKTILAVLVITVVGTLYLGIMPGNVLSLLQYANK
jgi:NADH-quinone oxidoreductase subunit N